MPLKAETPFAVVPRSLPVVVSTTRAAGDWARADEAKTPAAAVRTAERRVIGVGMRFAPAVIVDAGERGERGESILRGGGLWCGSSGPGCQERLIRHPTAERYSLPSVHALPWRRGVDAYARWTAIYVG